MSVVVRCLCSTIRSIEPLALASFFVLNQGLGVPLLVLDEVVSLPFPVMKLNAHRVPLFLGRRENPRASRRPMPVHS